MSTGYRTVCGGLCKCVCMCESTCMLSCFSGVQLFATLWIVAHQAPLSIGFSRQEYWNGLPCPPPGDLLNQGIKPASLTSPALAGRFFTINANWEVSFYIYLYTHTHTHTHTHLFVYLSIYVCISLYLSERELTVS